MICNLLSKFYFWHSLHNLFFSFFVWGGGVEGEGEELEKDKDQNQNNP